MLAVIILLILGLIGFGVHLNSQSNAYINTRLASRKVSVHGARARHREFRPRLEFDSIGLESEQMFDVVSEIAGTIVNLPVRVGERVAKGQEVCELDNRLIPLMIAAEQAKIDGLESELLFALNNLERHDALREKNVITEMQLEEIEAKVAAIRSQLRAARMAAAQLEEDRINQFLVANDGGNILNIYTKLGSRIAKGTPVMLLADFSRLRFQDFVMAGDVDLFLEEGGEIEIELPLAGDSRAFQTEILSQEPGKEETFPIRIVRLSPPLSEPAMFRHISWEVDNATNVLEPGLYIDAILRKKNPVSRLAIPESALTDRKRNEVYVVRRDDTLERRAVVAGLTDGRHVEIRAGLADGDIVVTSFVGDVGEGTSVSVHMEHDEQ